MGNAYIGMEPQNPFYQEVRTKYVASNGQTLFTGLTYKPGYIDVYVNGSKLVEGVDFTALNGNSVTLATALNNNDDVEIQTRVPTQIVDVLNHETGVPRAELASTASGKGASIVGFVQAGIGAVSMTVQAALRERLSASQFGVVGDGTNTTTQMQAALNAAEGRELFVPKPSTKYLWGELTIPSNVRLVFEPGTLIESNASLLTGTKRLLNIGGANVNIVGYGAKIKMVKAGFASEYNHGVSIIGASGKVVIEGFESSDTGGDGFYVNSPLADVTFYDCQADNNRRQGVSVVQAKSFTDYRGKYTNTSGTDPQAGIDIEPSNETDVLGPVRIYDPICSGNAGQGIEIFLAQWAATTNYADIKIIRPKTRGNSTVAVGGRFRAGINVNRMPSTSPCKGRIQIIEPVCEDEGAAGIHVYDWDVNGPAVEIIRPTIINPNQNNGASSASNGGIIFRNTGNYTSNMGNVAVEAPLIRDDDGFINSNSLNPLRFAGACDIRIKNPAITFAGANPWSTDTTSVPRITSENEIFYNASGNLSITDWRYVGRVITNDGATGGVTRALPVAKVGIAMDFLLMESFPVLIYPNAEDRIVPIGGAVGKYITASVRGARIRLICREAGFWDIDAISGTWTSEA